MAGWVVVGAALDCSGSGRGEARAPAALRAAGVVEALRARDAGDVALTVDDPQRDPATGLIAVAQLRAASAAIRDAVGGLLAAGDRAVVLGGDCTVLVGVAAAARDHAGRLDLVFVDGHADFLDGQSSPTGEAADMDLAIVTGHGPAGLADLGGPGPLVDPARVTLVGHRAADLDPETAGERARVPAAVRQLDAPALAAEGYAAAGYRLAGLRGGPWWLHLDLDVLDEAALPAVTYPQPGGPDWDDVTALLRPLAAAPGLLGVTVTDLEPDRDPDHRHTRRVVHLLADVLPG